MAALPTRRGSKGLWVPERSFEKHTLDHFERFCFTLKLPRDLGPFRLEDHELAFLKDYFDGIRRNLWLLPTGSRKSMLLGAVALHFGTYVCEDARIFLLGGMAKHAQHPLLAATGFVDRSPDLSQVWEPQEYNGGRLKCLVDRAMIMVASAGNRVGENAGSSVEGALPDLILVEELHRHSDGGGAMDTLWTKAKKTGAQMAIVTTAGGNLDSRLGELIRDATNVPAGAIVTETRPGEYYRRGLARGGTLVMHEWAVPDHIVPPSLPDGEQKTADQYDAEVEAYLVEVKRANPVSFCTIEGLRETLEGNKASPWVFQRQAANQWVTQSRMALDRVGWGLGGPSEAAGRLPAEIPNGTPGVVIGLDLSDQWDRTAIVPVVRGEEEYKVDGEIRTRTVFFTAKPQIIRADGTGRAIRRAEVISRLETLLEAWPDAVVAFDKSFGGEAVAEEFEESHGIRTIDVNVNKAFEQASMRLAELIAEGRIRHDGDEEMTAHILAAARKDSRYAHYWRLWKSPDGRPIDGAAALANAVWALSNPVDEGVLLGPDDFRITEL